MAEREDTAGALSMQRLFLLVVLLKLTSSVLAWVLGSPWLLGFALPLTFMALYIALGLKRERRALSDEKFADSCYYLGFIFTVSTIVVSLFDLPNIGARLDDIAVRFGAAMVSTVMGLIVRVYLVNFRQDFQDASRISEDSLLDSARMFRSHLRLAVDRLEEFDRQVDEAARGAAARVELAMDKIAAEQAKRMSELMEEIVRDNRKIGRDSILLVKNVTDDLAKGLNDYAVSLNRSAREIDAATAAFGQSLDLGLKAMRLPDDLFVEKLDAPLNRLTGNVTEMSGSLHSLAVGIKGAETEILAALSGVAEKTAQTARDIDQAKAGIAAHGDWALLARDQARLFGKLTEQMRQLDVALEDAMALSQAQTQALRELVEAVRSLAGRNSEG
jgi:hypothetical protein